jgi:hypothetical protein
MDVASAGAPVGSQALNPSSLALHGIQLRSRLTDGDDVECRDRSLEPFEHELAAPDADELLASARESGEPQTIAPAFAAAARLLLAQGRPQQAKALVSELEQFPGIRADPYYASLLPELVRTALALQDPELAARLVDGVQPVVPLFERALSACRAQRAEAAGEQAEAADIYGEAAERWREFGNIPERAYAVLGQGRCLSAIGDASAKEPLLVARELFTSMGFAPAVAETDALLGPATAAAR